MKRNTIRYGLLFLLLFLGQFLSAPSARAQVTCTSVAAPITYTTPSGWDCNQVPTINDVVIIQSGHTKIITGGSADGFAGTLTVNGSLQLGDNTVVRTLTVSGDVTVGASGSIVRANNGNATHQVNIGGNLTNNGTFDGRDTDGAGPLGRFNTTYTGSGTQTISGSNPARFNNLTIVSTATVNVPAGATQPTVEGSLTNNGSLVQTQTAPSLTTTEFLHIQNAAASSNAYFGVNITPDADMGSTTVRIKGNQVDCTTNPADQLLTRCYDIAPTTSQNATVRFYFTEAERNGLNASTVVIWHFFPGSGWSQVGDNLVQSEAGTSCVSGGGLACYVQADNISTFSPFGVGSVNAPTAVNLHTFTVASNITGSALVAMTVLVLLLLAAVSVLVSRRGNHRWPEIGKR